LQEDDYNFSPSIWRRKFLFYLEYWIPIPVKKDDVLLRLSGFKYEDIPNDGTTACIRAQVHDYWNWILIWEMIYRAKFPIIMSTAMLEKFQGKKHTICVHVGTHNVKMNPLICKWVHVVCKWHFNESMPMKREKFAFYYFQCRIQRVTYRFKKKIRKYKLSSEKVAFLK